MPKKMLWTELVLRYFPINRKIFVQQMLARLCLLVLVWLTGFLAYALDGLMILYVSNLRVHGMLFGMGFLILFGSYLTQPSFSQTVSYIRPMLKLDDQLFQKFLERVERYSYSFIPCLLMALGFVVCLTDAPNEFQQALSKGFAPHVIWNLSFTFFIWLLIATGIWMFISIWLTIFLISRQPLNVGLSPKTIETFRALARWALLFSLFYFLAVSIGILFPPVAVLPTTSPLEIIIFPYLFFVAIGVNGVFLPFYNIHKALLKLKKQELLEIGEESAKLLHKLDEVLAKQPARQFRDQTIAIMASLFSLQVKERHTKEAKEWPIDIGFVSKLAGLVFMPIILKIMIEIFTRLFIS